MKFDDIKKIKKGDILTDSWGYDMTINEYCEITKKGKKSFKCQMIGKKTIAGDAMQGKVVPDKTKKFCPVFNILIKKYPPNEYGEEAYLVGSHPFTSDCETKRKGNWNKWDETPDYENHLD